MIFAIVRSITSHDLVGIYAAADVAELRTFVGETCSPSACEWTPAPRGGVAARVTSRGTTKALDLTTALARDALSGIGPWEELDPLMEDMSSRLDAILACELGRELVEQTMEELHGQVPDEEAALDRGRATPIAQGAPAPATFAPRLTPPGRKKDPKGKLDTAWLATADLPSDELIQRRVKGTR